jgi:hypothetical protein
MFGGQNFSETSRANALVTVSWVQGKTHRTIHSTQIVFDVSIVKGAATAVYAKVLFSRDGVAWFTDPIADNVTATTVGAEYRVPVRDRVYTFDASGNWAISVPVRHPYATIAFTAAGADLSTTFASAEAQIGVA